MRTEASLTLLKLVLNNAGAPVLPDSAPPRDKVQRAYGAASLLRRPLPMLRTATMTVEERKRAI